MRSVAALLILPALFLFLTGLSVVLTQLRVEALVATVVGFAFVASIAERIGR